MAQHILPPDDIDPEAEADELLGEYSTAHEIAYLRALAANGKRETLLKYRRSFRFRDFSGPGMRVDKQEVGKELRRLLGPVRAGSANTSDVELLQTAREWLNGGNLRAAAKRHARNGDDEA